MVAKRATGRTRLQQVLQALGVKPMQVVREAQRLAEVLRRPSVSRQHFGRLRSGEAVASEDKIYIVVAAMRSVTGLLFRPADLFDVEPMLTETAGFGTSDSPPSDAMPIERGSAGNVPVFSDSRATRVWRLFVSQDSGSTDDAFESMYTEYGLLLRTIAMRRYHVPPDDAEALVHDIFTAYLQRRSYVRNVKHWLIGAIGNASSNYIRKRRPEAELLPEHEEAIDPAAEESLDGWIRRLTIAALLARLGTKCRETLRRYYLHEEPKERIAAELATSPAYVLQLLVSCRKRAQELLRSLGGTSP
jgi:RNA polymerase sigma factor (sigma-70 family)